MTAFILRQNNLWDDKTELNASDATNVKIPPAPAFQTPGGTPQQVRNPEKERIDDLDCIDRDQRSGLPRFVDPRPQKIPKYDYNLEGGCMKTNFMKALIYP